MEDNEIIKALECCIAPNCGECPIFNNKEIRKVPGRCIVTLEKDALDLINRQKEEIERLEKSFSFDFDNFESEYDSKIKGEAVKEFAERLKEHKIDVDVSFGYGKEVYTEAVAVIEIDNLVKEMVGDTK